VRGAVVAVSISLGWGTPPPNSLRKNSITVISPSQANNA
jgi:hypothetical protein